MYSSSILHGLPFTIVESFTGLAITNFDPTSSRPYKVINMFWSRKPCQLASYLEKVIQREKIGGLLVSYSVIANHMHEIEHRARVFKWLDTIHAFASLIDFPFTLVDERYSIDNAGKILNLRNPTFSNSKDYERMLNKYVAFAFTQTSSRLSNCTRVRIVVSKSTWKLLEIIGRNIMGVEGKFPFTYDCCF
ncbi:hypothetical protein LWI28_022752 [Acer negundo]|uniref:Uncharacterized protein n=1 Tax=Acer negundo TaxID=4023 RepID=A0AAD5P060_ACENE|nr:hypothetical protein LWI28_022752 [Acer negundo]